MQIGFSIATAAVTAIATGPAAVGPATESSSEASPHTPAQPSQALSPSAAGVAGSLSAPRPIPSTPAPGAVASAAHVAAVAATSGSKPKHARKGACQPGFDESRGVFPDGELEKCEASAAFRSQQAGLEKMVANGIIPDWLIITASGLGCALCRPAKTGGTKGKGRGVRHE